MTAKEFLSEKLQALSNKFKIAFSYRFDKCSDMHIVSVAPSDLYEMVNYVEQEFSVSQEFDRLFSPESILFVSEDDILVKVDNPEFTVYPLYPVTMLKNSWEKALSTQVTYLPLALAA